MNKLKFSIFIILFVGIASAQEQDTIQTELIDIAAIEEKAEAEAKPINSLIGQVSDSAQTNAIPPLNSFRIILEFGAGSIAGYSGGLVGYWFPWIGGKAPIWMGPLLGILGSTSGVYTFGSLGSESGSFLATLSGSVIAGIPGIVISYVAPDLERFPIIFGTALGTTIGATIGFNLTRKSSEPQNPLILITTSAGTAAGIVFFILLMSGVIAD